jgi:hypothetical protein
MSARLDKQLRLPVTNKGCTRLTQFVPFSRPCASSATAPLALSQAKTLAAHEVALAAAEAKAAEALSRVRATPVAAGAALRKPMWFERFAWFVSRWGV